jgi:hypothetical protein
MNAKELRKLTKEQLLARYRSGLSEIEAETVLAEIRARITQEVERPHWSTVPGFWISVVAAVAACIAAYPVLFPNRQGTSTQPQVVAPPSQATPAPSAPSPPLTPTNKSTESEPAMPANEMREKTAEKKREKGSEEKRGQRKGVGVNISTA